MNSGQWGFIRTVSHQSNFIACFDAITKLMANGNEVDHIFGF